jgi:hypothetical protein
MREIIVPDVHQRWQTLETLEPHLLAADRVVLLGDWFDAWKKGGVAQTLEWMKKHLDRPNWEWLLGNHDCHYFFDNQGFMCSGYQIETAILVQDAITLLDIGKFQVWTTTEDEQFLLSHAGFRPETKYLLGEEQNALAAAYAGDFHPMWSAGYARGGNAVFGGPTWLDFKQEFVPLKRQRQIVGHTHGENIKSLDSAAGRSYCIDTGLRHVAVYQDGDLEFVRVEDLK